MNKNLVAKTYTIPVIASQRSTCIGTQYVVETPEYLDIVTVNGAHTSCTCQNGHCEHIRAVERQRSQEAARDAQRAVYTATFDLGYGEVA